jgi:hypothetical protein
MWHFLIRTLSDRGLIRIDRGRIDIAAKREIQPTI